MEILGQYPSKVRARKARETMAGELGARYYQEDDTYRYERDGQERVLKVVQVPLGKDTEWHLVLE